MEWDLNTYDCGREQIDLDVNGQLVMSLVISHGTEVCTPPPPPIPTCEGSGCEPTSACDPSKEQCEPPPPPPLCEEIIYDGPNPITLPNSGDATELAFVNTFCPQCDTAGKITPTGQTHEWSANGNYAVVLVKAGTDYYVYTNVTAGQTLTIPSQHAISHVSPFQCTP